MSSFPTLGDGLGLRSPHLEEILAGRSRAEWFEALTENYIGLPGIGAGRPLQKLLEVRRLRPVTLHGVSLSLGGSDRLDETYLKAVLNLADQVEPAWISDHLCWTGVHGYNTHDLLPLPRNQESLNHVVARVQKVQETWKRRLIVENVSSYVDDPADEMPEWDFIAELVRRSGCGLLLDINNVYVSSRNHGFDPFVYLSAIPMKDVAQIHLAGHSDRGDIVIDTHDHPVRDEVWNLYASVLPLIPSVSSMVEWDANIPPLDRVEQELMKAKMIREKVTGSMADRVL